MSDHAEDALGVLMLDSGTDGRRVSLGDYLDGASEEAAAAAAHARIKALRLVPVDGQPLRRRFCFREDSLWWFAELYLHKQLVVLNVHRIIAALERLIALEQPLVMRLHAEISRTLELPEVRERIETAGLEVVGSTPAELAEVVRTEIRTWAKIAPLMKK